MEGCPSLQVLDMRSCTSELIQSDALSDILEGNPSLSSVIVSFNSLGSIASHLQQRIQVSRKFFCKQRQRTILDFFTLKQPTDSFSLPRLPQDFWEMWAPHFWRQSLS